MHDETLEARVERECKNAEAKFWREYYSEGDTETAEEARWFWWEVRDHLYGRP